MKIAIIGAGAIGGFIGARLAQHGHVVSLVARGATLHALQRSGLLLECGDERIAVPVQAAETSAAFGPQDLVIVAVKATAFAQVVGQIAPLLGPDTMVIPALNGLPWWYFLAPAASTETALTGRRLQTVDGDGRIEAAIDFARVMGIVVHASCSCPAPGVVRQSPSAKIILGEPGGGISTRAQQLTQTFSEAGFNTQLSSNIRSDIWFKLLGNASLNPVSFLTGAYTDDMLADPQIYGLLTRLIDESLLLGRALGIALEVKPAERMAQTARLGHIKTSMLQDVEAGRVVELDALIGALVETAHAANVPVPIAESVLALARLRAQTLGLYQAASKGTH